MKFRFSERKIVFISKQNEIDFIWLNIDLRSPSLSQTFL